MKLWSGRFEKNTDSLVDIFNSSISFDKRLYRQDILGSIAHVTMLGRQNIIPPEDSHIIKETLLDILKDIEEGKVEFETDAEDIHMNIEKILISRTGETGKRLHTARSRNDQVALDIRMYLREETDFIIGMLKNLNLAITDMAEKHLHTVMPGYTHLQRAQPITLAHHLMAYFNMFKRDVERLLQCRTRINIMPLGSGALAGTPWPIDRDMVASLLEFSQVTENSIDAVSDRDFVIELAASISIIMMHLSRFCEELVIWSSLEFGFIEMDDAFSTGSSIMPQKKNPDVAELVRGKTGRTYGNLITLLTVMKALPLAYNKDMQEDKEAIFDSVDTVKICLPVFTQMLSSIRINTEKMRESVSNGFLNATDLADYLVKKGEPFRNAHEISGNIVLYCIKNNNNLENLPLEKYKSFSSIIEKDVYEEIKIEKCISQRKVYGGPSSEIVKKSIEKAKDFLKNL